MSGLDIAVLSLVVVGGAVIFGCMFVFTFAMAAKARDDEIPEASSANKGMES